MYICMFILFPCTVLSRNLLFRKSRIPAPNWRQVLDLDVVDLLLFK